MSERDLTPAERAAEAMEAWKRLRRHLELENTRWTEHDSGRQERERDIKTLDEAMQVRSDKEIKEHISWMRGYLATMSERNWRDQKLYLERQLDQLEPRIEG